MANKDVVEYWIRFLQDNWKLIRIEAAKTLGKLRDPRAVVPLLQALKGRDEEVREAAAEALTTIGEANIAPIVQALQDKDNQVQEEAAIVLGTIGTFAVAPLLQILQDPDSEVRPLTARTLGRIGDPQAISFLLQALQDQDRKIRLNAAAALGQIGDGRAVPSLIQMLQDEDNEIRSYAVQSLGQIGDGRAVPSLVQMLQDEIVRGAAVRALGQIGDGRAVAPLCQALQDEASSVRWRAAEALGQIGDDRAVPSLIQMLQDEDSGVRRITVIALGVIGNTNAVAPLVQALFDDDSGNVRKAVVTVLGQIGDAQVITPLMQALQDTYWVVREAVVTALGQIGDTQVITPLMQAIQDVHFSVQIAAAETLGELGEPAVPPLLQMLQDETTDVRRAAAKALGLIGDVRAVTPLIPMVQDPHYMVRGAAIRSLGVIGDVRALGPIVSALQDETQLVQVAAARALGEIGDISTMGPLLQALKDNDSYLRENVAAALGMLGEKVVLPLLQALEDADWRVRAGAAKALGMIGDARAVEPLIQAIKDNNKDVQRLAIEALGALADDRAVAPLLQTLKTDIDEWIRKTAAEALDNLDWKPSNTSEYAYYLVAKQAWGEATGLGELAIPPLLHALPDEGAIIALGALADERTVVPLIQVLQDNRKRIQERAITVLVKIGEPVVPLLLKALTDANSDIRAGIVVVLGELGDERAVAPLCQALQDEDPGVQWRAAEALGKLRVVSAVEPLTSLLADPSGWVPRVVIRALGAIGEPAIDPLIQLLKKDLTSGIRGYTRTDKRRRAVKLRIYAIQELGKIGNPRAVDPLIQMLQNKNQGIQDAAAIALGKIGDPRAIEPLVQRLQTIGLCAAIALAEFGDVRAVIPLVKGFEDYECLLETLRQIGDEQVVTPLVKTLLIDESEYVRSTAAWTLEQLGWQPENATEQTWYFIAKEEWNAVVEIGAPAIPSLLEILYDEKYRVVIDGVHNIFWDVAWALGKLGAVQIVTPLLQHLEEWEEGWEIATEAIQAIGEPAIPFLVQALMDPNGGICGIAAEMLDTLGWQPNNETEQAQYIIAKDEENWDELVELGETAVPLLLQMLQNEIKYVRRSAAWTLGQIGDEQAISPLYQALMDTHSDVREAAVLALEQISWQPDHETEKIRYFLVKKDWEALSRIREPAIGLIRQILEMEAYNLKVLAVEALEQLGWQPENATEQINFLIAKWKWEMIDQLDEPDITPLLQILRNDIAGDRYPATITRAREHAVEVLGKLGDPRAIGPLCEVVQDKSGNAPWKAVQALGAIGDTCVVPFLLQMLQKAIIYGKKNPYHPYAHLRVPIIKVLGQLRDIRAVEPLIKLLKVEETSVQMAVIIALGQLRDSQAISMLIQILKDEDFEFEDEVRQTAVRVLGQIGIPQAIGPLHQALTDDVATVRAAVVEVLDKLGEEPKNKGLKAYYLVAKEAWEEVVSLGELAVEPLLQALQDEKWPGRKAAKDALTKIQVNKKKRTQVSIDEWLNNSNS